MQLPITKSDTGTQTDIHFLESNIVGSYQWNEWELRRKAIKLVSNLVFEQYAIAQLTLTDDSIN